MAQNDIYLVRQKADATFEEIAHSPFQYDAANITDLPDKTKNTFHINTKLRVDELEVNGKTTVIHTDTNTSEQLLVTNDGTGPAAVINQLGQFPLIDIQDDGTSALFIRGDSPYGGFVGLGTTTPDEQLHLTGSILLENEQLLMAKNISDTKVNILGMTNTDITNLNNVGDGITMSVGSATAEPKLFMHPSGRVGLGIETNDPGALLEVKRDGDSNVLFSHRTASILAEINVDKPEDKVVFKTLTDHALSIGTNALDFLTLTKEGNLNLEKKLSGSTLTGGDLTIDGNFTSHGDMVSFGTEELLFSKSLTSSGANVAKSYRVLEVGYNTHHWDHGTSFIIEVYSNHYSSQGYQKYILNHTQLDTSVIGSQDGLVDKVGSRDYVLKILEHEGNTGSYEFRARLGAPEDTGVNVSNYDVALVPLYIDVTNYANVRVKVTSFNSDNCKRISIDENWGASSADDEYKFNPLPTAEDITWTDHPDLPGSLDYTFAGRQALYADVLFGDGRINRIGERTTHQNNIRWALKLADVNTSLTVAGKVGIGTASPANNLVIRGSSNTGSYLSDDPPFMVIENSFNQYLKNNIFGGIGFSKTGATNVNGSFSSGIRAGIVAVYDEDYNYSATQTAGNVGMGLNFRTSAQNAGDSQTRMSITGNGLVGIGTSTPSSALEIASAQPNIRLTDTTPATNTTSQIWADTDTVGGLLLAADITNVGTAPYINFRIGGQGQSSEKMRITHDDKVGIGQVTPETQLHLGSNSDSSNWMTFENNIGRMQLGISQGGGVSQTNTPNKKYFSIHDPDNGKHRIFVRDNGLIGINTTGPLHRLDVVGSDDSTHDRAIARFRNEGTRDNDYSEIHIESNAGKTVLGTVSEQYTNANWTNSHYLYGTSTVARNFYIKSQKDLTFFAGGHALDRRRMTITADGDIGVGTTTPNDARLEIVTSQGHTSKNIAKFVGPDPTISFVDNTNNNTISNTDYMKIGWQAANSAQGGSAGMRFFRTTVDNPDLMIDLNGAVGIGTTSPDGKLDVQGDFVISRDSLYTSQWKVGITHTGVDNYGSLYFTPEGNSSSTADWGIRNNRGDDVLVVDGPTGVVTFSSSLSIDAYIRHTGDTNTYFGFSNNDEFSVFTNASTKLLITNAATTVNNVLQAHGGMTIATNEDNNTPELTLKRTAAISSSGADDIVDIRVADGGLNFIINNDTDGDAGTYQFQKMAGGSTVPAAISSGNINCSTITTNSLIRKNGDTNTYLEFHNPDSWRVVTGGGERFVVTNASIALKNHTNITGDLTVSGDLTVNGDLVTLNTTNLDIEDKVIKVAKNATNDAAASGSGISFGGRAALLYQSSGDKLQITNAHFDVNGNNISNVGTYTANSAFKTVSTGSAMFILQDSNSTNVVTQTGNISYQLANGTVSAEIGHMSNSDSDFRIQTVDGDIDIRPGGTGHKLEYNGSEVATRNYVDNNSFIHPTFNSDDFSIDTGPMTGAKVISDLDINVTTDSQGHVTDANGVVSTRNLTLADLGYSGASNANRITKTSELTNDSNFITSASIPSAVTNNNQLQNGAGYITSVPNNTVTNASVSGNTLTLTRQGTTAITFTATNSPVGSGGSTNAVEKAGAQTMAGPLTITGTNTSNQSLLAAGDVVAMTSSSDERLKKNILKVDSALDKICSLEGFTFDWNDKAKSFGIKSDTRELGLSAQETEKVIPEAVKTFDESDYKYINYEKLVPVLVEAIKELKSEIQELKKNQCDC